MTPVHEQDPRVVLQDIKSDFTRRLEKWMHRETGHAHFASIDCMEHLAALDGLMSILCERSEVSAVCRDEDDAPVADAGEVDHPGR
jgi:hypothetical protein